MASKREATEKVGLSLEGMSDADKAQILAMLSEDYNVAKIAKEEHGAKVLKSATLAPSERKPSKSAQLADVVAEVNGLFAPQYTDAQAEVSIVAMEAMDKLGELCKAKGLDVPGKARFVPNGEESPGYKFVARGGTSTWRPKVYQVDGEKPTTDLEKDVIKAAKTLSDTFTSSELKDAMGIDQKTNILKAMNRVLRISGDISRPSQA